MERFSKPSIDRLIADCKNHSGYRGAIFCSSRGRANEVGNVLVDMILSMGWGCSTRFSRSVITLSNGSSIRILTAPSNTRGMYFNTVIADRDIEDMNTLYELLRCEHPFERPHLTYSFSNGSGVLVGGENHCVIVDDLIPEPPDYGEFQCPSEITDYFKELVMEDK